MAASVAAQEDRYGEFRCAVCLNFLDTPVRTSCNHVFCHGCITDYWDRAQNGATFCPICCLDLEGEIIKATDLLRRMKTNIFVCSACNYRCKLIEACKHEESCDKLRNLSEKVAENFQKSTGRLGLKPVNRSTFSCPYCGQKNFVREDLLAHCNEQHKDAPNHQLVCTMCISYPWGDKNQKSGHLLEHLNKRHQFDFDRFVDFEQDDEESLAEAKHLSTFHH